MLLLLCASELKNLDLQLTAAFDDVNSAKEDKETYINKATSYANEVIPEAEGEAAHVVNKAENAN